MIRKEAGDASFLVLCRKLKYEQILICLVLIAWKIFYSKIAQKRKPDKKMRKMQKKVKNGL